METDKEYFVIDRIECSRVVVQSLLTGEVFGVEKDIFIDSPKEGNALFLLDGCFKSDPDFTFERKKSLHKNMQRLFKRNKK